MKLLSSGWNVNPRIANMASPLFSAPATQTLLPRGIGDSANNGQYNQALQWARRIIEKVKASNVKWVPWQDDLTEERSEHRDFYRPMLREPIVKAALGTKVYAIAGQDAQVHPADPDNPRDQEAAGFARFALGRIRGGTRVIAEKTLYPGLIDGCSICEPVWDDKPVQRGKYAGKRVWKAYKSKDIQNLRLQIDEYKNITGIQGIGFNSGQVWQPEGFVIWSHMSFFENPQGMSDLRAAYRDFWLKQQSLEFRSLHLEKFTSPYLKGTLTAETQRAALEVALEEAKGSTWVIAPIGVTIEALDLSLKGTADYQSAIDNCDRNMLIAIVGAYLQILEGQVSDGRGDTGIHKETSELFQWMLSAALGDVVTWQMMPQLYAVNYPDVEPGTVTWGSISEPALTAWITNSLSLQQLGVAISKKEAYTYCARTEPADEADTLIPPALAPAAPMGFGEEPEPAEKYTDQAVKQLMASFGGVAGQTTSTLPAKATTMA